MPSIRALLFQPAQNRQSAVVFSLGNTKTVGGGERGGGGGGHLIKFEQEDYKELQKNETKGDRNEN